MRPIVALVICFCWVALCHGKAFPGEKVTLVKIISAAPGDLNNFHIHARAFGDYNGYDGFPVGGYGGYPLGPRILHGYPLAYGHAYPFGYGGGHGGAIVHATASSRSFGHGFGQGYGYNRFY